MSPLVSFLIPAFKGLFLAKAIDSILSQSFTNFELIIVNDCSPDDIDSIVSKYNDSRIRYYHNEKNIGGTDLVAQWNKCLEYAVGQWTIMASDDDIYDSTFLEELLLLTKKRPDCDVIHSNVKCINANEELIRLNVPFEENEDLIHYAYFHDVHHRWHSMPEWMLRTEKLRKIGGFIDFPSATWSDVATIYVMAKENGIICCNKPLLLARNSGINITFSPKTAIVRAMAWEKYSFWCKSFFQSIIVSNEEEKWMINQIIDNCPGQYVIRAIINEASINDIKQLLRCEHWPFTLVSKTDIKKSLIERKRLSLLKKIKFWRKTN